MDEKKYPISEIFTSWQGEGLWAGTRMTFIRFAGCNVGKKFSKEFYEERYKRYTTDAEERPLHLPIWQEQCTTFDGRKFCCDTDFRVKERLTVKEILDRVPEGVIHIVFTGGEPLLHIEAIELLMREWIKRLTAIGLYFTEKIFHIETSGTILFDYLERSHIWITISPKANWLPKMIQRANEVKFLVDEKFPEDKAEEIAKLDTDNDTIFWLSPINGIDTLDKNNLDKCKEIAERHPKWRITQQSHKLWNVR